MSCANDDHLFLKRLPGMGGADISIFVTGFSAFGEVHDNPTEKLVEKLIKYSEQGWVSDGPQCLGTHLLQYKNLSVPAVFEACHIPSFRRHPKAPPC